MTKEQFSKLPYTDKLKLIENNEKCGAEWVVETVGGSSQFVSCKKCGQNLINGQVPRCLFNVVSSS